MRGVRIQNDALLTSGLRVSDIETGAEIKGIASLTVSMKPGDIVRADIELCAGAIDTPAEARFYVNHPETGVIEEVREIVFADGSKVSL